MMGWLHSISLGEWVGIFGLVVWSACAGLLIRATREEQVDEEREQRRGDKEEDEEDEGH